MVINIGTAARTVLQVEVGNGWLYLKAGDWDRFWQWGQPAG